MLKEILSSNKIQVPFPHLEKYASFLLENLDRVVDLNLELLKISDLPLWKHLSHMSEKELLEMTQDSQVKFLNDLKNGDALKNSMEDLLAFKEGENPLITTSQVEAEDFVVAYSIRAQAFHHFLLEYTSDPKEILGVVTELEKFNALIQTEGFRVFIEIKEEQLKKKNDDLTKAFEALQKEKKLSESILDTSFDAIVAFDTNLRYTAWNTMMEELSGISRTEGIGKTLTEVFPNQNTEANLEPFKRVLKGEKVYLPPTPYGHMEGYYEGYLAPLLSPSGKITGAISVVRDISELKKKEVELNLAHAELEKRVIERTRELSVANKELQRINTELEDFAYTVSHDLKAPLRAINTIANFLKEDFGSKLGGDGISQLELLTNRVKRMGSLIEGILHYAKAGRDEHVKDDVNLNHVLPEIIENVGPDKKVKLIINDHLPIVKFPRVPLIQVLQNLVVNAIKYNDKDQCIVEIGGERKNGANLVWVKDNGPGVDEKYHQKIFRPFQTLAPRDQIESTGIGLAVVKKVVEMEGGQVWLESQPGKGCTFYISIPD